MKRFHYVDDIMLIIETVLLEKYVSKKVSVPKGTRIGNRLRNVQWQESAVKF